MPIKVFDFFSGCGGTSAGLEAAGMEISMGLDIDADAAATFCQNFPNAQFIRKDLTKLRADALKPFVPEHREVPILFCGCAPCQPFSKQNGQHKKKDHRVPLLRHFGRFVIYFKPEFVLVENVPGLQQFNLGPGPLPDFLKMLKRLKYEVSVATLDCCDYGVPQKRSRFVLMASLIGSVSLPPKTHGPDTSDKHYSTVGDWISDLPALDAGQECSSVPNHRAASLSATNLKRIKATPPGGGRLDWPEDLVLKCHSNGHSGHTDVYGRLRIDQPASALTTRCISLSNGRFGHPTQNRAISVREAACLQTFPRNFVFHGNLNSMARQVGNAVPPLLAQRLGEAYICCANERYPGGARGVL